MKGGKTLGERLSEETVAFCGMFVFIFLMIGLMSYIKKGETGTLIAAIIIILIIVFLIIMPSKDAENKQKPHKSRLKVKETSNENKKWCNNCCTYIPESKNICPHCGSINITTPKSKQKQKPHKSPLKVKETSNENKNWCNNCCSYIPKEKKYCPICGSVDIKKK